MTSMNSDESSIERARDGKREALEKLLLAHAPKLSRHIARRLPPAIENSFNVDDILQETLLRAFLDIHTIEQTSATSFFAWLKAIADMRLLDALKAKRRQKRGGNLQRVRDAPNDLESGIIELIEQLPDDSLTASRRLARREATLAMQVAVAGLPSDQQQAIRLRYFEGMDLEEAATTMGRSVSAVRSLIHRGKQKLAEAMGRASLWLSR